MVIKWRTKLEEKLIKNWSPTLCSSLYFIFFLQIRLSCKKLWIKSLIFFFKFIATLYLFRFSLLNFRGWLKPRYKLKCQYLPIEVNFCFHSFQRSTCSHFVCFLLKNSQQFFVFSQVFSFLGHFFSTTDISFHWSQFHFAFSTSHLTSLIGNFCCFLVFIYLLFYSTSYCRCTSLCLHNDY